MAGKFNLVTTLLLNNAGFSTNLQKASKDAKAFENAIGKSNNAIKESFGVLTSQALPAFGQQFGALGSIFGSVKTAFLSLIPAINSVSAAIIATGVGAIVIAIAAAIAGLIAWMKRTDEGTDAMRKAFDVVKAVIQTILNKLTALGTAIVHLFKGEFKEAADSAKEAVTGWGEAIKKNIAIANELNKTQDKLEDYDETYALKKAQIEEHISALQEKATNMQDYSAKERLAAAQELKKVEEELYKLNLGKKQLELDALKQEISMGADNQDNRQKINEKEAELVALRTEYNQGLRASNKLINKNLDDANKQVAQEKEQADYIANPMQAIKGKSGLIKQKAAPAIVPIQKETLDSWDLFIKKIKESQDAMQLLGSAVVGFGDAMAGMIAGQKGAFKSYIGEVLSGIRKVLLAKLAEAIMSIFAGESSKGVVGLALAAGGAIVLSGVYQRWAGSFAGGGIIGGNSKLGDRLTANVNSGEMILNQAQQSRLFAMANGSTGGGNVRFEIDGTKLVGVLQNNGKKYGRLV
jgi:hypothetical protein